VRAIVEHAGFRSDAIRPDDLLRRYRGLVEADAARFLPPAAAALRDDCPGCLAPGGEAAFERFGYPYRHCASCGTLWSALRPSEAALRRYHRESDAERFWQDELARRTGEARIAKVVEPRLDWISDTVAEHRPGAAVVADVGTHLTAFAERFAGLRPFRRRIAVDPLARLPGIEGLEVVDAPLADAGLSGALDALSLLDVADRASDADALFAAARAALAPGGILFVTGILASGFDVQVLWDRAETVFPPDRLTLFSVTGLEALLARHGFEVVEFSTPGAFDLRAVADARAADPTLPLPRFVETLLARRGAAERELFQRFLQEALLSSFGRIAARRAA
jgi:SAM-dependent methyltransferase